MSKPAIAMSPWDGAWHLRAELGRILDCLERLLARQRTRGRSAAGEAVRGFVIEDGEAEGLVAELATDLARQTRVDRADASNARTDVRREIADRAATGASQGAYLPLRHAARAFELTDSEYNAFLLALAVEQDARFGRLVAYLNDHAGRTRPTVGMALALESLDSAPTPDPVRLLDRPFIRDGLVEIEGEGPLPGLALKLPRAILERLAISGSSVSDVSEVVFPPDAGLLGRIALDEAVRRMLSAWCEAARRGQHTSALIFAGADGSGRTTAARAAASEAGLPLVVIDASPDALDERLRLARRESRWHHAAVLLRVRDPGSAAAFDWRLFWSELATLGMPLFVAVPPALVRDAVAGRQLDPAIVSLEPPDAELRLRLWQATLPPGSDIDATSLAELAAKFRFTPGAIGLAVRRASADLLLAPAGERRLSRESLERASRSVAAAGIGSLAQKLPVPYRRDELVVPPELGAELDLACAWVRQERKVLDEWGFRERLVLGFGLTALFTGPPGTGKTMAAQVLARELGMDLFRVDLSRIMSKYIGETEKHLAQLFDQAQSAVLFFDEADALFGKRSEVKDAHDRYANVEIGYLLQRMEEHDGVTVLATNRMRDMDEAFVRRFHVIAHFPMPAEPDRLRIWTGMFPKDAALGPDVDLARLARDFELSGGEIKNAALASAYLAADEGNPIGMAHLRHAIRREMVKAGRVVAEKSGSRAEGQ